MASSMLVRRIASLVLGRQQQQQRMVFPAAACLSTTASSSNQRRPTSSPIHSDDVTLTRPSRVLSTQVVTAPDGRQFAIIDKTQQQQRHRRLKPSIVRRRIEKMRVYEGKERDIRHSPWRLNLVCQLAAGLPLLEALQQLDFCKKSAAPLVQKVLKRTSNLADIRHGLQPSQLEVAECFATHGKHLKRMKIMGRGRAGVMHHRYSHMRVVLREIDFRLKIYQAATVNKKKRWIQRQMLADEDAARANKARNEIAELQRQAEEAAKAKK